MHEIVLFPVRLTNSAASAAETESHGVARKTRVPTLHEHLHMNAAVAAVGSDAVVAAAFTVLLLLL